MGTKFESHMFNNFRHVTDTNIRSGHEETAPENKRSISLFQEEQAHKTKSSDNFFLTSSPAKATSTQSTMNFIIALVAALAFSSAAVEADRMGLLRIGSTSPRETTSAGSDASRSLFEEDSTL